MIRVLLVPSSDYLGHPFPQRHNQIFERLHDCKDFEVHVVRFNLFDKIQLNTKLIVHELGGLNAGSLSFYYLLNAINHASQIRRLIRQESIDVVVMSNLAAPLAFALMNELSDIGVPIVVDLPDHYPTNAAGYLLNVKSIQGKLLSNSFDLMLRYIMKHADVVTVASHTLDVYAKQGGARRVEYVPNGIGECFLEIHEGSRVRGKLGFDDEDFVVGYVGSVEFWLDLQTLFKGTAIAIKRGLPAKILIVGKSLHTNYMKKVEEQMKREGISKSVTWTNFVSYEEVPFYMNAIDVGTIPFDIFNPEAFYSAPNKMWEYLSQRRPVISTPIPEAMNNSRYLSICAQAENYSLTFSRLQRHDRLLLEKTRKGYFESKRRTWAKSTAAYSLILRQLLYRREH